MSVNMMAPETQSDKQHEQSESQVVVLSDDDDDDAVFDYDADEVTLSSIKTSKTVTFSIRANYTEWEPREAFREFVQNW